MLGPVQNRLQYQRLQLVWEEIAGSGTKILFRGSVPTNSEVFFFPVTLLDNPPGRRQFCYAGSLWADPLRFQIQRSRRSDSSRQ